MTSEFPKGCYETVGGLVYFARMCSKVRLRAAGKLGESYFRLLGGGFDGRTCRFLGVDYDEFVARVSEGGSDQEVLDWCFGRGRRPNGEEILIFNSFMTKRGWRDEQAAEFVPNAIREAGLTDDGSLLTIFDTIEAEEGRWHPDIWRPVFPAGS